MSVGDVPPIGPGPRLSDSVGVTAAATQGERLIYRVEQALDRSRAQSAAYKAKLAEVSGADRFNLYYNFLAVTGGVGSAVAGASDGTLKAWAFASGLGAVTERTAPIKSLRATYDTAIRGFGCVDYRSELFRSPTAASDWQAFSAADPLEAAVAEAEAGIAAGVFKTDDDTGRALAAMVAPGKAVAAKARSAQAAINRAPETIGETIDLIDDTAQKAERSTAVDVAALITAIEGLNKKVDPTPGAGAPTGGDDGTEGILKGGLPGDRRLQLMEKIATKSAALTAVLNRVDYVDAAQRIVKCAVPGAAA